MNPLQASRYRERHGVSGAKSDQGDAHMLAGMVRTDSRQLRPAAGDSPEAGAIKVVARTHKTLIWERTRGVQRLRHQLREYFPSALEAFEDLDASDTLELLGKAPDPARAAKLTRDQVSAALKRARRRNIPGKATAILAALPACSTTPSASKLLGCLSAHDAQATLYLPTSHLDAPERGDGPWLSWAEVDRLPHDLVEIGSHAHVHRPLDVLPRADVRHEVQHSRRRLAEWTGVEPVSFCYPNGYSNRPVRRTVSAAGYANACILGRRLADPGGDPYAVPRLQVTPAHDEAGILSLITSGEPGWTPRLKRSAYPAWRVVRLAAYRGARKC